MLRDADSYRDLLDRTAATLDKMEEQLKSGGGKHHMWPVGNSSVSVRFLWVDFCQKESWLMYG